VYYRRKRLGITWAQAARKKGARNEKRESMTRSTRSGEEVGQREKGQERKSEYFFLHSYTKKIGVT